MNQTNETTDTSKWAEKARRLHHDLCWNVPQEDAAWIKAIQTALEAAEAVGAERMRERAAAIVKPRDERPCGCEFCDCGKPEDAERVGSWDADQFAYVSIRALDPEEVVNEL